MLLFGLGQFNDLDVLVLGVDIGGAEGGEEDKLVLAVILGVVENVVDGDLKTTLWRHLFNNAWPTTFLLTESMKTSNSSRILQ